MLFERLLHAQVQRVLLTASILATGCAGEPPAPGDPEGMCADVTEKQQGGYSREPGFLKLPLDERCPEVPTISAVQATDCCPVLLPVASCALVDERVGAEQPYYGGYSTSEPEEATICEYDMVFEVGLGCCGRPLYVSGSALLATVQPGPSDWTEPTASVAANAEARSIAVAYWREVALMEHASVASFGRVALELMRHGAPAELIRRAHEAALDEIQHAQLAFGIVEALSGAQSSPGPLPLGTHLSLADSLADVAEAVVREGCIGETLAAIDAATRLSGATGVVADALATIVDDESRHAGLAWATLRWLLEVGGSHVRNRVDAVFAEAPSPQASLPELPEGGAPLGLISDAKRDRAMADARLFVIAPAWAALRDHAPVEQAHSAQI